MKNFPKHATTVATVVAGVAVAGYLMYEFRDNDFIKKARNGFQGIA